MIDLFTFNSMGMRYGSSKLFQILIPLAAYILIRDILIEKVILPPSMVKKIRKILPSNSWGEKLSADLPIIFERSLGFLSWKIGCDLGFFLIATGLGPWHRAFTWSGLIPYTIVQYLIYHLVGRKMIIGGTLNPFGQQSMQQPMGERPKFWKQIFAKYFHEDMNSTSYDVPMRQVILKPLIDYLGLIASWSTYTIGIFYFQSGEVNVAPLIHFSFYSMFIFYFVNTYGYIIGFNIGELLYSGFQSIEENFSQWRREESKVDDENTQENQFFQRIDTLIKSTESLLKEFEYNFYWQIKPFLNKYGLNPKWVFSATCGVFCITVLAPGVASLMFSLGANVNESWFALKGQMDPTQLAQVIEVDDKSKDLPNAEIVLAEYPHIWQALYDSNTEVTTHNVATDNNLATDNTPILGEITINN